jgi:hypothetical protein
MQVKSVEYSRGFNLGPYEPENIKLVAVVDDGDSVVDVIRQLADAASKGSIAYAKSQARKRFTSQTNGEVKSTN